MSIKVWENFWKWNYPEISVHVVQEVIGIFYWQFVIDIFVSSSEMGLYVIEVVIDIFGRHLKQIQLLSENSCVCMCMWYKMWLTFLLFAFWEQKLFQDGSVCGRRSNWHFWETFEANPIIVGKFWDVSNISNMSKWALFSKL